jgi:hypothetical protein
MLKKSQSGVLHTRLDSTRPTGCKIGSIASIVLRP